MNIWVRTVSKGKSVVERARFQKIWDECAKQTRDSDNDRPYGGNLPVFARTALLFNERIKKADASVKGGVGISKAL